ncbi:MAG: hypothetical protein ACU843_12475 [Gammaproteobacteria bacterium]
MIGQCERFAARLARELLKDQPDFRADPDEPAKVLVPYPDGNWARLNLTPFCCETKIADAGAFFDAVQTTRDLLEAYHSARKSKIFEEDLPGACDHVAGYASDFMQRVFERAGRSVDDRDARRIAKLVADLDVYTAVKSVESLLNSHADLALLRVSERLGWTLHFDHLAIRCGNAATRDAQRVVENLQRHHDYVASQIESENYFEFEDGWDAYVLFKVLDNGQQIRLFIDQSLKDYPTQIIQHWNHVYGYTPHHLALRVTRRVDGERHAVSLEEQARVLGADGVEVLSATGQYTAGLLQQVFTRPESNNDIPAEIRGRLRSIDPALEAIIENGKLLELISRREMKESLKSEYFSLYGIVFDPSNPLHSAPLYAYFLPAQAAHVIRTSVQVA